MKADIKEDKDMKNYRITYKWILPNALYVEDAEQIKSKITTLEDLIDCLNVIKENPERYELISVEKI